MPNGLTLLRHSLVKLHIVCEAMGISPDDVDIEHFPEEARARWRLRAHEDIRRAINEDPSCVVGQRQNLRVHQALTGRPAVPIA